MGQVDGELSEQVQNDFRVACDTEILLINEETGEYLIRCEGGDCSVICDAALLALENIPNDGSQELRRYKILNIAMEAFALS